MRDRLLISGPPPVHRSQVGPRRVDTFNNPGSPGLPHKDSPATELHGNSDFLGVEQSRGKGCSCTDATHLGRRCNVSASFGTGAYPPTLDANGPRTAEWLKEKPQPPAYPYPVDRALAAQGVPIYQEYCARCHGKREAPYRQAGSRVGTVVPIDDIGTDRHRFDSYTWTLAVNQGTLYAGYEEDWGFDKPYPQRFTHSARRTATPLAARRDLAARPLPAQRLGSQPARARRAGERGPRTFFRGSDVYDPANVVFVWDQRPRTGGSSSPSTRHARRNGNGGHTGPDYGTALSPDEKKRLLEYLKTF